MNPKTGQVPVRTILATIGLVLATAVALLLLYEVQHVLVWIVVALFFTVALYPVTAGSSAGSPAGHRTPATILVFLVLVLVLAGLVTAFAVPLATEGADLRHPAAAAGHGRPLRAGHRGPAARAHPRADYVQSHQSQIAGYASGLTGSARACSAGWRPASPGW